MKTKESPKIQANKWKAGKPRIRRCNGGWVCYLPGTSPTFGYTMRDAYNRWHEYTVILWTSRKR